MESCDSASRTVASFSSDYSMIQYDTVIYTRKRRCPQGFCGQTSWEMPPTCKRFFFWWHYGALIKRHLHDLKGDLLRALCVERSKQASFSRLLRNIYVFHCVSALKSFEDQITEVQHRLARTGSEAKQRGDYAENFGGSRPASFR